MCTTVRITMAYLFQIGISRGSREEEQTLYYLPPTNYKKAWGIVFRAQAQSQTLVSAPPLFGCVTLEELL